MLNHDDQIEQKTRLSICASADYRDVMSVVAGYALERSETEYCQFWAADGDAMLFAGEFGKTTQSIVPDLYYLAAGDGVAGSVWQVGEVFLGDFADPETMAMVAATDFVEAESLRAVVGIPIAGWGVLVCISRDGPRKRVDRSVRSIADVAAAAILRANELIELQIAKTCLRAVEGLNEQDDADLMSHALGRLCKIFEVPYGFVLGGDPSQTDMMPVASKPQSTEGLGRVRRRTPFLDELFNPKNRGVRREHHLDLEVVLDEREIRSETGQLNELLHDAPQGVRAGGRLIAARIAPNGGNAYTAVLTRTSGQPCFNPYEEELLLQTCGLLTLLLESKASTRRQSYLAAAGVVVGEVMLADIRKRILEYLASQLGAKSPALFRLQSAPGAAWNVTCLDQHATHLVDHPSIDEVMESHLTTWTKSEPFITSVEAGGVGAELIEPVVRQGKLLGFLCIPVNDSTTVGALEMQLVQLFADHLAVAESESVSSGGQSRRLVGAANEGIHALIQREALAAIGLIETWSLESARKSGNPSGARELVAMTNEVIEQAALLAQLAGQNPGISARRLRDMSIGDLPILMQLLAPNTTVAIDVDCLASDRFKGDGGAGVAFLLGEVVALATQEDSADPLELSLSCRRRRSSVVEVLSLAVRWRSGLADPHVDEDLIRHTIQQGSWGLALAGEPVITRAHNSSWNIGLVVFLG